MHPSRLQSLAHLRDLAAQDHWQELYQRTMLWEFPDEALLGFQLAFYRPFAVPRMAEILTRTGQFAQATEKRSYDTGLIMYEILHAGLDAPAARRMVALINRMHRRFAIEQEDFTYILNAFIVVPLRHIDRVGWRPLLDIEREASCRFYRRLGELMGIVTIPASYRDAERMFDEYEQRMVAPSPQGHQLGDAVLRVLRRRLPLPLRPIAGRVNAALIGDHLVSEAIGLPAAGGAATLMTTMANFNALRTRRRPAPQQSWFTPGQAAGQIYPHGYQLADLGDGSAGESGERTASPRDATDHQPDVDGRTRKGKPATGTG